jgi:hypothetical protein
MANPRTTLRPVPAPRRQRASAGLALALAATACGQLIGADAYRVADTPPDAAREGTEPPPDTDAVVFADARCGACMQEHCAAETDACLDDATCAPWHRCWAGCPPADPECRFQCYAGMARSNGVMGDQRACALGSCQQACSVASNTDAIAPGCEACALRQCEPQIATCSEDPACLGRVWCDFDRSLVTHPDPARLTACHDEFGVYAASSGPDGAPAPSSWATGAICVAFGCAAECQLGERLDCGAYALPPPTQDLRVVVRAHESPYPDLPGLPFGGVEVSACRIVTDPDCRDPVDTQTTDDDGRAVLTIPPSQANVYFQLEVELSGKLLRVLHVPPGILQRDTEYSLAVPGAAPRYNDPEPPSGIVWSPGTGFVFVVGRDCFSAAAKDLVFSIDDANASVAHYGGYPPDINVSSSATHASGYGANLVNVAPGRRTLRAHRAGELVASKEVVVRADWITFVYWMYPTSQ